MKEEGGSSGQSKQKYERSKGYLLFIHFMNPLFHLQDFFTSKNKANVYSLFFSNIQILLFFETNCQGYHTKCDEISVQKGKNNIRCVSVKIFQSFKNDIELGLRNKN